MKKYSRQWKMAFEKKEENGSDKTDWKEKKMTSCAFEDAQDLKTIVCFTSQTDSIYHFIFLLNKKWDDLNRRPKLKLKRNANFGLPNFFFIKLAQGATFGDCVGMA